MRVDPLRPSDFARRAASRAENILTLPTRPFLVDGLPTLDRLEELLRFLRQAIAILLELHKAHDDLARAAAQRACLLAAPLALLRAFEKILDSLRDSFASIWRHRSSRSSGVPGTISRGGRGSIVHVRSMISGAILPSNGATPASIL